MRFLQAAGRELLGLFIGDWVQSGVVMVIVAVSWFAVSRLGAPALVLLVLFLAAQLVWFAFAEGRRPSKRSPRQSQS